MAPKKASAASRGKAVVQGGEAAEVQRDGDFELALSGSRFETAAQLDKVRHMVASKTNEHKATALKPASDLGKLGATFYPVFLHTLFAGLVPPFL